MEHKRKAFHLNAFRVIFVYSGDKLRLYSTGGNPYGASTRVGPNGEMMDDIDKAIEVQVKRMIDVTAKFKG